MIFSVRFRGQLLGRRKPSGCYRYPIALLGVAGEVMTQGVAREVQWMGSFVFTRNTPHTQSRHLKNGTKVHTIHADTIITGNNNHVWVQWKLPIYHYIAHPASLEAPGGQPNHILTWGYPHTHYCWLTRHTMWILTSCSQFSIPVTPHTHIYIRYVNFRNLNLSNYGSGLLL